MTDRTRLLVVDDDASICQVLKAGLEMHGFTVRYETRSSDTIKACLEFHPELILLDMDMPDKDGGDVASELRDHPTLRHTPVIFRSALVAKKETGKRSATGQIFLSKQVPLTELVTTIGAVLRTQTPQ